MISSHTTDLNIPGSHFFCGEGAGYRRGRQGFLQKCQIGPVENEAVTNGKVAGRRLGWPAGHIIQQARVFLGGGRSRLDVVRIKPRSSRSHEVHRGGRLHRRVKKLQPVAIGVKEVETLT